MGAGAATGAGATSGSRWIRRFGGAEQAPVRLLCFPHAGGAAGFFFPLSRTLAPEVEVTAVQYPGRQDRRGEPGIEEIGALARGAAQALAELDDGRPLALFGHSMGAVVAYETARILEHERGRPPVLLFASGRRAPCVHREEYTHLRDDEGLLDELRELGGTDAGLLADRDLMRLVLPAVRVDYRAIETYRHRPGAELSLPIAVLTGDRDPRVTTDEAAQWRRHTTGEYSLDVLPGGHFFLGEAAAEVERLVTGRLHEVLAGGVPGRAG
ncbi:thioesterase II family protein [Streptomyces sp. NPDC055607]